MAADGLSKNSTDRQVLALSNGFHGSDLSTLMGAVDDTVGAVQKKALESFKGWLAEWPGKKREEARFV